MNKTKQERNAEFKDRFEIDDEIGGSGAFLLSSDGCFKRHDKTRDEQQMTEQESKTREFAGHNIIEWADGQLCQMVALLQQKGIKIMEPTLEEYVSNHIDMLMDYDQYHKDEVEQILKLLWIAK